QAASAPFNLRDGVCIASAQSFALYVAHVRYLIWILLAQQTMDFLRGIRDKQFTSRRGDILTAVTFIDLKLRHVVIEPHPIAPGALKCSRKVRCHRLVLDD